MRIDLHMHTNLYSPCASMKPEELAATALERGLDAIVITEHNNFWKPDELNALRVQFPGLKIFNGIEVTVEDGDHFLVFGVINPDAFWFGTPLSELVANVRKEGGALVFAHPFRYGDKLPRGFFDYEYDGIEVMSSNTLYYMKDKTRELRERLKLPGLSCTDAHSTGSIGLFATDFFDDIANEGELAEAIRKRRFRLYADRERIEKINSDLEKRVKLVRELIDKGMDEAEVKKVLKESISFVKGVARGLDLRLVYIEE